MIPLSDRETTYIDDKDESQSYTAVNKSVIPPRNSPPVRVRAGRVAFANGVIRWLRNTESASRSHRGRIQGFVHRFKAWCESAMLGFLAPAEIDSLVDRVYRENVDYYNPERYKPSLEQ